jgi:hypothetical protein
VVADYAREGEMKMIGDGYAIILDDTAGIVAEMVESEWIFHLTGSRYFQVDEIILDYDFFVQESEGVRNWLKKRRFRKTWENIESNYADPSTLEVWSRGDICVQLVENAVAKGEIQDKIKKNGLGPWFKSTEFSNRIWNLAWDLMPNSRK